MNKKKSLFKAEALFAASNSSQGFKSYYDKIFEAANIERLYIIKGGPGTGKSRFMKEVASFSEKKGFFVEYYRCSSDPDSLDAVIIDDRIAVIDGTSPHAYEPRIVGARDEIINLGAFWNAEKLAKSFLEIEDICLKKQASYKKGYRYLSGCGELFKINDELIFPALKESKMLRYISRLVSEIPQGEGYSLRPALQDSVGMKGRVRFDTYEKLSDKLYSVIDWYGTAHFFLAALATAAQRRCVELRVSYNPVNPERIDGLFFCKSGIAFVACDAGDVDGDTVNRINMRRFLDKKTVDCVKKEYKHNVRLYDALLSSACDAFAEAGEYHFELEKIYSEQMDFKAKESYTASFCEMLGRTLLN